MKIAIGADHGGYRLKENLIKFLKKKGHRVKDFGTFSKESYDYPLISFKVSKAVGNKKYPRGILICKTGVGMSIAANKVKGVRAALCDTVRIARLSRLHNDSNVLVLAAKIVNSEKAKGIARAWLSTLSLGGRHRRRVGQIKKIERSR